MPQGPGAAVGIGGADEPALAGKGSASIPVTSSNSMSRRRTDMGALLEADMGPT